jgi:hypothetical protein
MAETKPACSSAKNASTSPPGVDANKGNCGPLSGDCVITLTFDRGVVFDEKKLDDVKLPSRAMANEPTHPSGITVEIVGIERGDRGRSCEEHDVCGTVVTEDTLLRLRKEQILVDGQEETAIACYWVTDGIDRCRVGFLKRHMVKHSGRFDGALVQVTKVYSADPRVSDTAERRMHLQNHGCALGAVVSAVDDIKKNRESLLADCVRKRKAQEEAGYPLNRKYGLPIP